MLNILLVEDNPGAARRIREALVASLADDFELVQAETSEAAVRHLDVAPVDVILIDGGRGDATSVPGLAALRTRSPAVPMVVLGTMPDDATALAAIADGADEILGGSDSDGVSLARAIRFAIERRRAEGRADHLRQHDALTDVASRPALVARLTQLVSDGPTAPPFALLLLDIDDFTTINAALGHTVGDQVLQSFAARLRSLVRPEDLVARVGSDEFMVVVEGASRAAGTAIVQHIVESLARVPLPIASHEIPVSALATVTCGPEQGLTVDALLRAADRSLDLARLDAGAAIAQAEARRIDASAEGDTRSAPAKAGAPLSIVWAEFERRI